MLRRKNARVFSFEAGSTPKNGKRVLLSAGDADVVGLGRFTDDLDEFGQRHGF
jgi:hypothetical protein